uniref:ATP synthase F0 subunit 8 n=1 Tax=Acrobeloides nanus TaxID=290746 RepID=A0A914E8W2_9BILA
MDGFGFDTGYIGVFILVFGFLGFIILIYLWMQNDSIIRRNSSNMEEGVDLEKDIVITDDKDDSIKYENA